MANTFHGDPFIIGIDIDDTLTPYTERFIDIHARRHGIEAASMLRPTSYDMGGNNWPNIASTLDYLGFHNDYVRTEGLFSGAKTFEYADEALRNLRAAGAYIKIITTRFCSPEFEDKSIVIGETAKFLINNGLEYDEFMISSTKDHIKAHVYVDDSPSNVKKFVNAGSKIIVPNTTGYTEATAREFGVPLMQDWRQGEAMLMEMMEAHYAQSVQQEALFEMA